MSLNNKITLLLVGVYLLLLTILAGQRIFFDIPELRALQSQSDFNEVDRIVRALQYQRLEVSRISYDYGVWDDTYKYIEIRDPEYIDSNYVPDTFASLSLNGALILDLQGEEIWSGGYLEDTAQQTEGGSSEQNASLAELFRSGFDVRSLALTDLGPFISEPITASDLVPGEHRLLIVSQVSVLPTDAQGLPRGTFVMVRAFTDDLIGVLADITQQSFTIHLVDQVGNDPDLAALAPVLDKLAHDAIHRVERKGYRWLKNAAGEPVAMLEVALSEAIYRDNRMNSETVLVLILATLTMLIVRIALQLLVLNPLHVIRTHLKTIRESANYSLRLHNTRRDEVGGLSRECDSLVDYVKAQEEYLLAINQDLTRKSLEDGLTEVANRRHFDLKIELLCRAFAQKRVPIFVVLVDVDCFKAYNDKYGHLKGDETLKAIAETLLKNVRVNTDMVARYGGEEFVVLLTETDITGVKVVCEKLLQAVRMLNIPHEDSGASARVTVSMGVAGWTPKEDDALALLAAADKALYEAKAAGRDCVQYHIRDDSISR